MESMTYPPHLLNQVVREGHLVTFPDGAQAAVLRADGDFLELEGPKWINTRWFPRFALIREDQLSTEDAEKLERIKRENQQRFLATLPPRLQEYARTPFDVSPENQQAVNAVEALSLEENLLLFGRAGTGKTMLVVRNLWRLAALHNVRFWSEVRLCQELRNRFDPGARHASDAQALDLLRPDVLVIDDVGKAKHSAYTFQELFAALDERWVHKRSTVLTSNYTPDEAALKMAPAPEDAEAILSRITSGAVITLVGPDGRMKHHKDISGDQP
jgi:DNA replication protein DnaC